MLNVALFALLTLSGCTGPDAGQRPDPKPVATDSPKYALAAGIDFAELEIPEDSRGGVLPPGEIILKGPWTSSGTNPKGMQKFDMPVPIRSRALFFHRAQAGMAMSERNADGSRGTALPYQSGGKLDRPYWNHDRKVLTVSLPPNSGNPPNPDGYYFKYPKATQREKRLNYAFAKQLKDDAPESEADFVRATIQDDWESRQGLLLPAPGVAAFDVTIPENAELSFLPGLVEPELFDLHASNGATLTIEIEADGKTEVVFTQELAIRSFEMRYVDLSRFAGKQVRVRFKTDPMGDTTYDYAFIAEPIIAPRSTGGRKVVMVFVDTLRPDHLTAYGYERDTSPALVEFAKDAVVFENARSIAPWTLPSARTVVTGRQPEFYDEAQTVQGVLREKGWANAMLAGNVYLSANFDMNKDWDLHRVGMFPSAEIITDQAIEWLDQHDGHDSILLIHYMDAHLPYIEPMAYRYKYAGDGPSKLPEEFHRSHVVRANLKDAEERQYVKDRYDNNIRYIDDQLARLFATLDDDDIVVFYSDHGEEFWDHNGFEHGHTLFDEVLRVPLVIKAPGVKSGSRVAEPASLLDITPTLLELLGEDVPNLDGLSLVGAMKGDSEALKALGSRDQAFGRPLYGLERWGVLHDGMKWLTSEGREALYDVDKDRAESNNLLRNDDQDSGAQYRQHMAKALNRPVEVGYRVIPTTARGAGRLEVDLHVPGGIKKVWDGADPLRHSALSFTESDDGEHVKLVWRGGQKGTAEFYIIPNLPIEEVTHQLSMTVRDGSFQKTVQVPPKREAKLNAIRYPLARVQTKTRTVALTWGITPLPPEDGMVLDATDDEANSMLAELGYVDSDDACIETLPEGRRSLSLDINGDNLVDRLIVVGLDRQEVWLGCKEGDKEGSIQRGVLPPGNVTVAETSTQGHKDLVVKGKTYAFNGSAYAEKAAE